MNIGPPCSANCRSFDAELAAWLSAGASRTGLGEGASVLLRHFSCFLRSGSRASLAAVQGPALCLPRKRGWGWGKESLIGGCVAGLMYLHVFAMCNLKPSDGEIPLSLCVCVSPSLSLMVDITAHSWGNSTPLCLCVPMRVCTRSHTQGELEGSRRTGLLSQLTGDSPLSLAWCQEFWSNFNYKSRDGSLGKAAERQR